MRKYNQIKSESYAKMMRDNFPLSFENENLNKLLNEIVYDDEKTIFVKKLQEENKIMEFKNFIYSLIWELETKEVDKNSQDLLDLVWYDFYVCKTKEDVEKFKKYYKEWEILCTFNSILERLNHYHIFWIVKKDIDNIVHQWANRNRQDIYWTSCCSIQINKNNNNDISIKNRYNHWVKNCDATFSNNLDNIVEWLTQALNKEFKLKTIKSENSFELWNFIFKNDKFLFYNYEINNIYYWINKIFKNGELKIYNPDNYILLDYYLINIKEKKIEIIDNQLQDDFFNFKFKKIIVKKEKDVFKEDEDVEDTLIIYK